MDALERELYRAALEERDTEIDRLRVKVLRLQHQMKKMRP